MTKRSFFLLHLLLLIYSTSEVFSKLAAARPAFSSEFILCYGLVIFVLFLYAIGWQQIIKQVPLSSAFANKAVTTIWGTVWGVLLFHEKVTTNKLVGIALIIIGIILLTGEDTAANE